MNKRLSCRRTMGMRTLVGAAAFAGIVFALAALLRAQAFDLVIANGRVLDPASGLVVSPGFIDLHAHGQTPETYRYQARDGVTTALELEVGTGDIDAWYSARKARALINYGVSVGHIPVRMAVLRDPGGCAWVPTATSRCSMPSR